MNQSVEQVVYGNPTREQLELMQRVTPYDYLLPKMFETLFPSNISTFVQDEIKTLIEYQKEYNFLSDSVKKRYAAYDYNLPKAINNYVANRYNFDATNIIDEIVLAELENGSLKGRIETTRFENKLKEIVLNNGYFGVDIC